MISRGQWALALGGLLLGCTTTTLPAGNLLDPSVLTIAPSATAEGGQLVLIGEGDGQDLRAFVSSANLFVKGPNAISALSIPLQSTMNGQVLRSFRAERLAGGSVTVTGASGPSTLGYALVAGSAARIAVVDTQTHKTTVSAADAAACAAGSTSLSCLPSQGLDVATTPTQAFVLVDTDPTGSICVAGHQCVMTLAPSVENGSVVLSRDAQPVIDLGVAQWDRMRLGTTAMGSMLFLSNNDPTTINGVGMVPSGGGAVLLFTTAGGARVATSTPDGAFVLAVLATGAVQTLDPTTLMPVTDGATVLLPLNLGVPAADILFMPCSSNMSPPCVKTVRINSTTVKQSTNVAMLAMGDGSVVPLFPDAPSRPQLFSPYNLLNDTALSDIGNVGYSDSTVTPTPMSLSVTGPTLGITRTETISVVFQGNLPQFVARPAVLTPGMTGAITLTDPGAFGGTGVRPAINDLVRIHLQDGGCAQLDGALMTIAADPMADTLTLTPPAGFPCTFTSQAVAYDVVAASDMPPADACGVGVTCAGPWVVSGSYSGFLGRAAMPAAVNGMTTFTAAGTRYYYPPGGADGGQQFILTLTKLASTVPTLGSGFFFTTTSGLAPFSMSSPASANGLAISLAALNDLLYVAILGGDSLTQIDVPNYNNSGSVTDYR